ncbi:MAG: class I SAM-dependent methyltransferase, partial [Deltaproteobacteria bacterium]
LDALEWRLRLSFEKQSTVFSETIDASDGRYQLLKELIANNKFSSVLDAGCGKGRYLRNILNDFSGLNLHASDLSTQVMSHLPVDIERKQGSLLRLPYPDSKFDLCYTVEALEHAVHVDGALRELTRVLKPGGKLLIIDKNINRLGSLKLPDWEQWFETEALTQKLQSLGCSVMPYENIPYEGKADGLFTAWVATKAISGVNA